MGPEVAALLLLVALGACVASLGLGPFRPLERVERWLLATATPVLLLAVSSLALARLGLYSPALVSVVLAAFALAVRLHPKLRAPLQGTDESPPDRRGTGMLVALLVVLAALYALFPTYFLLGGQDPGLYLVFATRIAKTGGLSLDLPWLRELFKEHPFGVSLGFPGIYSLLHAGVGKDPTALSPQFMHLFPAWGANAWAVGGVEGVVRANVPLALLSLTSGFALVRRLIGPTAGLILVLALGLNPAVLWGARITLTETLGLLLTLLGLFLLLLATDRGGSRGLSLAGGAVLGLSVLNRLDGGFSGLALLGLALASVLDRRLRSAVRLATLGYVAVSVLGYADGATSAPFYFRTLVRRENLVPLLALCGGVALLSVAIASVPETALARWKLGASGISRIGTEILRLLAVWLAIALFAWPRVDADPEARNALELTFYLTPVAWPLVLFGMFRCLKTPSPRTLPVLVLGGASLVVFTVLIQIAPLHIWASRRWVPQVIPTVLILSLVAGAWLNTWAGRLGRLVSVSLAFAYFVPALSFAQPFLFRSMLRGLPEAQAALVARARSLSLKPPFVANNPHLGSVLTYVYDLPTAMIGSGAHYGTEADADARFALGTGELAGLPAVGLDPFELGGTPLASGAFQVDYLEEVEGRKPRAIVPMPFVADLGVLGDRRYEAVVPATFRRFPSQVGERNGTARRSSGQAGYLQGGPCASLFPGRYEVDWTGRVLDAGDRDKAQGALEAVAEGGKRMLATLPLRVPPSGERETWLGGLDFSLDQAEPCISVRMSVEAKVIVELERVVFRRVGQPKMRPSSAL